MMSKQLSRHERELQREADRNFEFYDDTPAEPEIDDAVRFCPECETPNQFGELCARCKDEAGN